MKDDSGKLISAYKYKKQLSELMNLDKIESGFDSMMIRIWFGYHNSDSIKIVVLKNNKTSWRGELIIAKPKFVNQDSLAGVNFFKTNLKPKLNWENFVERLFDLGLMTLSCSNKNDTPANIAEADGVSIELATSNYYSFCIYESPRTLSKVVNRRSDTLAQALSLINDQFSSQLWRPANVSKGNFEKIESIDIKMEK